MSRSVKIIFISIFVFLLSLYIYIFFFPLTTDRPITSDGSGYYAYLPSLLIDHSIKITDPLRYDPHHNFLDYPSFNRIPNTSYYLNKYPPGTALLMLPGFLIAAIISIIMNLPVNGYNHIFQHAVGISTITYAFAGVLLLFKILKQFFSQNISIFTCLIIISATSFITYTTFSPVQS